MIRIKSPVYRLTKYFLTLLLMTNFCSAFAGATVIHDDATDSSCSVISDIKFCFNSTTKWHSVETHSGNEIIISSGTVHITGINQITNLTILDETRTFKERFINDDNEFIKSETIQFFDNLGVCKTTTWKTTYKMVNGMIIKDQISHEEVDCI